MPQLIYEAVEVYNYPLAIFDVACCQVYSIHISVDGIIVGGFETQHNHDRSLGSLQPSQASPCKNLRGPRLAKSLAKLAACEHCS